MLDLIYVHESQICVMHECRCLQCMIGSLGGHSGGRELAQLVIDQRQQLIGGRWVASLNSMQNLSTSVIETKIPSDQGGIQHITAGDIRIRLIA